MALIYIYIPTSNMVLVRTVAVRSGGCGGGMLNDSESSVDPEEVLLRSGLALAAAAGV